MGENSLKLIMAIHFGYNNKGTGNETINKQVELHSKEINQQNEKAAYGMGENICKPSI